MNMESLPDDMLTTLIGYTTTNEEILTRCGVWQLFIASQVCHHWRDITISRVFVLFFGGTEALSQTLLYTDWVLNAIPNHIYNLQIRLNCRAVKFHKFPLYHKLECLQLYDIPFLSIAHHLTNNLPMLIKFGMTRCNGVLTRQHFQRMTKLESLCINECENIRFDDIRDLTQLKTLTLCGFFNKNGPVLNKSYNDVLSTMVNLVNLCLDHVCCVTESITALTQLRHLTIRCDKGKKVCQCYKKRVFTPCNLQLPISLETLRVSGIHYCIGDEQITSLVNLNELCIENTFDTIGDYALDVIGPSLSKFYVQSNTGITEAGIARLISADTIYLSDDYINEPIIDTITRLPCLSTLYVQSIDHKIDIEKRMERPIDVECCLFGVFDLYDI